MRSHSLKYCWTKDICLQYFIFKDDIIFQLKLAFARKIHLKRSQSMERMAKWTKTPLRKYHTSKHYQLDKLCFLHILSGNVMIFVLVWKEKNIPTVTQNWICANLWVLQSNYTFPITIFSTMACINHGHQCTVNTFLHIIMLKLKWY